MSIADYYKRQFRWRDWPSIFGALPPLEGRTVLDLGCGVGDQAAELVARGACVIGMDMSQEVLQEAQSRHLPNSEFRLGDLRSIPEFGVAVDGIWSSFATAYFPDLPPVLAGWGRHLKSGGWIALTEIDDFFGHEPLSGRTKALLEAYARDGLAAARYDFHMGRKLQGYLEQSGFTVTNVLTVEDQELSFSGPAQPEVIDAWRARLDGMKLLQESCAPSFEQVREEFLECLRLPGHRSSAKVYCCVATK